MNRLIIALMSTLISITAAATQSVTDVLGRTVQLDLPVQSLILTEGRQFYLLAALKPSEAADYVAGWRPDLASSDPYSYQQFSAQYPSLTSLPEFGRFGTDGFDLEKAVALKPDAIIVNVTGKTAEPHQAIINKLDQFGIPVVFVDFRHDIQQGTPDSFRLFGELLNAQDRAQEILAFRQQQIKRVTDVLDSAKVDRPSVFIERIGGYSDDCCMTFGQGNLGLMVEMAGGTNIASEYVDGLFGQLDPEQVLASNPDQIIVTSANWEAYVPGGKWIPVGPGADLTNARDKLAYYPTKPAYAGTRASKEQNYHAIWHGFYTSPFHFVALQYMATWLHPELFPDLNPEATLAEFYQRFLPIDFKPGYAVSLLGD